MKKIKAFLLILIFGLPLMFVGCKNSNKHKLSTPTDLEVESGGIVTFKRVEDDEYYTISINDFEVKVVIDSANPYVELFTHNNVDFLSYNASRVMSLGESYNVKVKAQAEKKQESDYSKVVTYTHTIPVEKPSNLRISGNVLTWDEVEHASLYVVKVITPADKTIYDYDGKVITSDDAETIANADLTRYQFSANRFDFSTILNQAGEYKFYVSAIASGGIYSSSGYTYKTSFIHQVKLGTPEATKVVMLHEFDERENKFVDNLHLTAVVDENTTAIEVDCDGLKLTNEISVSTAVNITENIIDINLNKLFAGEVDFSALKTYTFRVRSVDNSASAQKFYLSSDFSDVCSYTIQTRLTEVESNIELDEKLNKNVLVWSAKASELEHISGYKVYVVGATGLSTFEFDKDTTSFVLPAGAESACVQAMGKGGYLSSFVGEPKSILKQEIAENLTISSYNSILTWTSVDNASYIVEIANEVLVLNNPGLDLLQYTKQDNVTITFAVPNFIPVRKTFSLSSIYPFKLETPYVAPGQGFTSSNTYLLTFTGVNNAIGYYIYLTGKDMEEPVKIPHLFTSTSINLAQYIINTGEYRDYDVQIQAVADKYSPYANSDLTESGTLHVTHSRVLEKPEFKRDELNNIAPVERVGSGESANYYLNFYGVPYASKYEIMISYNKITQESNLGMGLYRINITNYLTSAKNYTIMVRALPSEQDENIKPSEYNTFEYALTKQLDLVTNIRAVENDGIYTLSFDMQENAVAYRVRIVKLNDGGYQQYLQELGLSNPFEVIQTADITDYVKEAGEYYIYVTALAMKNGYYGDSDESQEYGKIDKLTTLNTPTDIEYKNESKENFLVRFKGDGHADYYIIKVTNPNGQEKQYISYTNQQNINSSITVEGNYIVSVKAMVSATGDNAKLYSSSPFSEDYQITHMYREDFDFDFERYSVRMYGEDYNFMPNTVNELQGLLWHHYLYGVDENYNLKVYVKTNDNEEVREAVVRFANEATEQRIYNFATDETWLGMLDSATDGNLFVYLSEKLLGCYPEMAILADLTLIEHQTNSKVFRIYYRNSLDEQKVATDSDFVYLSTDYGNDFNYLDSYSRRGGNTSFAIDALPEQEVETSEQLLQAVIYGRKPKFVGNSIVAETIYENAKQVLIAIANNSMSDTEKVTAIFDWLAYSLNLNHHSGYIYDSTNHLVMGELKDYGLRQEYYLEGLFLNLNNVNGSNFDGEFYIGGKVGTDQLYAKAFSLLCAIEGIQTVKVNGEIAKINNRQVEQSHAWNKVKVNTEAGAIWYAVDLTYSDNYVLTYDATQSYSVSSHTFFMVSDSTLFANFGNTESSLVTIPKASTNYNYYANSSFGLTRQQILQTVSTGAVSGCESFVYLKEFQLDPSKPYQKYTPTSGYDELQAFILNTMFACKYDLFNNVSQKASFEFSVYEKDMGNSILPPTHTLDVLTSAFNTYYSKRTSENVRVKYFNVYDSENQKTTYVFTFEIGA